MKRSNSSDKEQEIVNKQTDLVSYALAEAINNVQEKCVKQFGHAHPAAITVALGKLLAITIAQLTRDYDESETNVVLKPILSRIEHEVLHNKSLLLKNIQKYN
jgi:hypothetical protein